MDTKAQLIACLTQMQGQFVSGETLAQTLQVSRNTVWKMIKALQAAGYPIEARKRVGYRMESDADVLTESTICPYLQSRVLGQKLKVFDTLASTNSYCREQLRTGEAVHGMVVAANTQTAGRGRQGRSFYSPPGSGLYFSLVLRQAIEIDDGALLTACAAVAVARAIDALCHTYTQIKWVNDLYLDGRKCCGILTEGSVSLESGKIDSAVLGIGINIRCTQTALPESLRDTVTSLEEAVPGCRVCRAQLLAAVLWELEQCISRLSERQFLPEYRHRCFLIGETVTYRADDGTEKKVAVLDIDNRCGLMVRDAFGQVQTLRAGEIHIGAGGAA